MVKTGSIVDRVRDYLADQGIEARETAALSPGALAVRTDGGCFQVYFASEMYESRDSRHFREMSRVDVLFPDEMKDFGLGLLPSPDTGPQMTDFNTALIYAVANLLPKDPGSMFYRKPRKVG